MINSRALSRWRQKKKIRAPGSPLIYDEGRLEAQQRPLRAASAHRAVLRTLRNWRAGRIEREAHRIKQPTLLIWGENDLEIPLRHGEYLQSRMPDARLIVFRHCGHLPQEEYPQEFTKCKHVCPQTGRGHRPLTMENRDTNRPSPRPSSEVKSNNARLVIAAQRYYRPGRHRSVLGGDQEEPWLYRTDEAISCRTAKHGEGSICALAGTVSFDTAAQARAGDGNPCRRCDSGEGQPGEAASGRHARGGGGIRAEVNIEIAA